MFRIHSKAVSKQMCSYTSGSREPKLINNEIFRFGILCGSMIGCVYCTIVNTTLDYYYGNKHNLFSDYPQTKDLLVKSDNKLEPKSNDVKKIM